MPNFSSLARLEVPEKFLWWGGVGWGLQSHFHVKPNRLLRLGWGFDNLTIIITLSFIIVNNVFNNSSLVDYQHTTKLRSGCPNLALYSSTVILLVAQNISYTIELLNKYL